ncbi:hypothetical protein PspLS_06598 [Pyricularia sp. CBS 133598]|nr:hypothetical protein PspLS_06598 [Pyricularia sp. CBS 133598]
MLAILFTIGTLCPSASQASTGPRRARSDPMTGFLYVRGAQSHTLLHTLRMLAAVLSFLAFGGHIDTFYVLFPLFCNMLHGFIC